MIETPCFRCRGHGFHPWLENCDSTWHGLKKKKKKKEVANRCYHLDRECTKNKNRAASFLQEFTGQSGRPLFKLRSSATSVDFRGKSGILFYKADLLGITVLFVYLFGCSRFYLQHMGPLIFDTACGIFRPANS